MRFSEFNINENNQGKYRDLVFLKPGQLKGSYSERELTQYGFKKASNGSWYISRKKFDELVSQGKLSEGLKTGLAAAGLAGAMALGGAAYDKVKGYFNKQPAQQTQQVAQPSTPKEVKPLTKNPLEKFLLDYAKQSGLTGVELAQFMAQCAHETRNFNNMVEYGGIKTFNNYDPKFNPRTAKLLGNKFQGDGSRFKGRGFIQLTGRYNYTDASKDLGIDLVNNPDIAADPEIAAKVAVWFWKDRVKPSVNDYSDIIAVTRKINKKLNGIGHRAVNFQKYMATYNGDQINHLKENQLKNDPKKDPEEYKQYLIKTLPSIMRFLKNSVSGWTPSVEQMLDAIDIAYNVMKDTGDIKLAGKAFNDELNSLHKISQNNQDVSESSYKEGGSITHDGVKYDFDKVLAMAETKPTKECPVSKLEWVLAYDEPDTTRLKNADISVPVVITKSNNGKLTVIDGLHRLAKAVDKNVNSLPVKYITNDELQSARLKQGVAEGKVKLYTDPGYFGAEVDNTEFDSLPVVNISVNKLVGFEPDSKMSQPESQSNVEKIVTGLKKGDRLPPILVRKYKDGYQVLDGHHRFWAYKLLGVKSIPSRIVPNKDIEEIGKQGVVEDQSNDDLEVINKVESSFHNGYHGVLIAKTPERQVGYLSYSIYNDVPKIEMIYVAQDYRRHGVAKKMLKALQEISPNEEIDWGYTTDDGTNLKRSIDFIKKPNPEIIKKKAKLAGVRSKLARLNIKLEKLMDTNPELARRYVQTVGDRWNKLNDIEHRLKDELYSSKGEYSKFIPETEK